MLRETTWMVAFAVAAPPGCAEHGDTLGGDPDAGRDVGGVDTAGDTSRDTGGADTPLDPDDEDGPCFTPPPCPEAPLQGILGSSCRTSEDCEGLTGAMCRTETVSEYDGEWYVENPGGACELWALDDFCQVGDDGGCPEGSRCISTGSFSGWQFHGCVDECAPGDASGEMYEWACGCRRGYRCDLAMYICMSGCSNDRQCCERWVDEDGDWRRDEGEVTLFEECESYCDGDDPEETADCMATWSCVNPGTPDARIGDPCEHHHQCPPDGECISWTDPETGEDVFPGGYCTKVGCQLVGRGCEEAGGWCMNTGTVDRPGGRCLKPCHVGREMDDPDYECRTTPGQEQACFPVPSLGWIGGAPPGGEDGFCFPGNVPGGEGAVGDPCTGDDQCASPLGLGTCTVRFGPGMCTVACDETLAEQRSICGGVDAEGVAEGLCGSGTCVRGCPSPGMPLGSNGCPYADQACAPLSTIDYTIYVAEGALKPPGFCLPACVSDAACAEVHGEGSGCDELSGLCS